MFNSVVLLLFAIPRKTYKKFFLINLLRDLNWNKPKTKRASKLPFDALLAPETFLEVSS